MIFSKKNYKKIIKKNQKKKRKNFKINLTNYCKIRLWNRSNYKENMKMIKSQ